MTSDTDDDAAGGAETGGGAQPGVEVGALAGDAVATAPALGGPRKASARAEATVAGLGRLGRGGRAWRRL